jgi:hypothetical protein
MVFSQPRVRRFCGSRVVLPKKNASASRSGASFFHVYCTSPIIIARWLVDLRCPVGELGQRGGLRNERPLFSVVVNSRGLFMVGRAT